MRSGRAFAYVIALFLSVAVLGQEVGPLELAKRIFDLNGFPELSMHVTGEYSGRPSGEDLASGLRQEFRLLDETDSSAVVAMALTDSAGNGSDAYLFFQRDTIWKMNAFRALAMTGMIEDVKNGLEALSPREVEEMIRSAADSNNKYALFSTREEYDFMLGNARLTLASDSAIIRYFEDHRSDFERIKDAAVAELERLPKESERTQSLVEDLQPDYRKLFISSVSQGYELGDVVDFLIGGMLDNSVGYFYAKDPKNVPRMDPSRIIMVREIGNGWYLYKTT